MGKTHTAFYRKIQAGKFVHDALREGQRLRPKTWGKKSRCSRKARREAKRDLQNALQNA